MSRVWLRRSSARSGLLAAMAWTLLVAVLLCVVTVGLAQRSQQPAVRHTVLDSPVQSVGVQAQAALASDAEAQSKAADRVIRRTFAGVPIHLTRSVVTSPVALDDADARRAGVHSIVLMQDDAVLRGAIRISSGSWPAAATRAPYPAALQADAARRLHLAIGDRFSIPSAGGALRLQLAATWRPVSAAADIWFGDQRVASGVAGGALGPLIVGAKALGSLDATPSVSWVVSPDGSALQPNQLAALEQGFASLDGALSADNAVATGSVTVSGDGRQTAEQMSAALAALGIVVSVPVTLLAVGAVLALLLLARLLSETRQAELTLLRARGVDGATVLKAAAAESAAVGMLGALVAALGAVAIVSAATGGPPTLLAVLVPAIAAVLAVVVVQTGLAAASIRSALSPTPDSGRARSLGSLGAAVLVVAAAGFALWRFLAYSSATGGGVDLAATAAPVLVLLAAVLLGLAAIGPLARLLDASGSRASGVLAAVTARQLARSIRFVAAPIALVILAVGGTVLASSYVGSWTSYRATAARIENGGDLRVATGASSPISGPDALGAARNAAGVSGASIAIRTSATLGSDTVPVLAAHLPALGAVLGSDADALHLAALRAALPAPDLHGSIALPAHASSLTLSYSATASAASGGSAPTARPTAWLADSVGDLVPVVFPSHPIDGGAAVEATAAVPASSATWHIVAVDIELSGGAPGASYAFTVTGASAGPGSGHPLPVTAARGWQVASAAFASPASVRANSSGIGMRAPLLDASFGATVRLMPGTAATPAVAVTEALAQADDLHIGNTIALDGVWWTTDARVAVIVPVLPGESSSRTMLFDIGALRSALLHAVAAPPSTNELWLATNTADAVRTVTAAAPVGSRVSAADTGFTDRFFGSAIVGLWLGALGGVAFSVIALAAAAAALTRRRRSEVGVLRTLGFSLRQQVRMRSVELSAVSATGVLIGIGAGLVVTIAVTAALVRLTVIASPPALGVPLLADPYLLVVGIGVLVVSVAVVVAGFRIRVRQQAADTAHREETR